MPTEFGTKAGFFRSLLPVIAPRSTFIEYELSRGLGVKENGFGSVSGAAAAVVTQHLILSACSPGQRPLCRESIIDHLS